MKIHLSVRKPYEALYLFLVLNHFVRVAFFIIPESISKWDKSEIDPFVQFKDAYTMPPQFDSDPWFINYLGHPYQGAYYYNSVRSQGAPIWTSGLFCLGHTLLWEYGFEAFAEQPSIQDLIVTPIAGLLFGEFFHRLTIQMSRNGYSLTERILISIINPVYALNNGFRPEQKKINQNGG